MRVAPRSLTSAASVSITISAAVAARLSTGQVQVMSPTVRKRTSRISTFRSPSRRRQLGHGHQQALALDHLALVRVVERRQGDLLALDVLPHVQFGPVADREHAEMLAGLQPGVEQRPQLGPLGLGLPLAEAVAVREDALLGAGFFFVAAGAANQRVKAEFVNRLPAA